jgi:ABC-2 type transport system ATP-binding protein
MLQVINVSKSFPGKDALKNINLEAKPGTIMGLIGPNGAGKSTLLKIIVDIYTPDCGEIMIKDKIVKDCSEIKELIGYVADKNDFFNTFKIKEIIKYYKLAYKNFNFDRFNEINKTFQIPLNMLIYVILWLSISRRN